ncbi:MAG: hypothetical protein H6905_07380 [Hyphomicrobiales bacterium]|nr:hypothetical protein [Hyphomicrobiales bacterium]
MATPKEPCAKLPGNPATKAARRRLSWPFISNVLVLTVIILASSELIDACQSQQPTPEGSSAPIIGDTAPLAAQSALDGWRSRTVLNHTKEFRTEVLHATEGIAQVKLHLRDDVLAVFDRFIAELGTVEPEVDRLRKLGQQLGAIINSAPASDYQLQAKQFTLTPGVAYFLPGGRNSIALVGPSESDQPHRITIRRNGRRVTMAVGSVRTFRQGAETCKLTLNEVGEGSQTATFAYDCKA